MADCCLVPSPRLLWVLSATLALAVGCAQGVIEGGPPEADGGSPLAPAAEVVTPLAEGTWRELDFAARKLFMREAVMPTMRQLFVELDPERFANFSCSSCHGSGASGTFSMPSSDLPVLGGGPAADGDDEIVEFMRSTVKPKMSELLGDAELRCSGCHPSAS